MPSPQPGPDPATRYSSGPAVGHRRHSVAVTGAPIRLLSPQAWALVRGLGHASAGRRRRPVPLRAGGPLCIPRRRQEGIGGGRQSREPSGPDHAFCCDGQPTRELLDYVDRELDRMEQQGDMPAGCSLTSRPCGRAHPRNPNRRLRRGTAQAGSRRQANSHGEVRQGMEHVDDDALRSVSQRLGPGGRPRSRLRRQRDRPTAPRSFGQGLCQQRLRRP